MQTDLLVLLSTYMTKEFNTVRKLRHPLVLRLCSFAISNWRIPGHRHISWSFQLHGHKRALLAMWL